jgi:hypothetical protein
MRDRALSDSAWKSECQLMPLAKLEQVVSDGCGVLDQLMVQADQGDRVSHVCTLMTIVAVSVLHDRYLREGKDHEALSVLAAFTQRSIEPSTYSVQRTLTERSAPSSP